MLQTLGVQNPLPVNVGSVQALLAGTGSPQGMLGSIGSLFNTNFNANHVYTPTGDSFEATLLQRNATGIAGIQALVGQVYQSMSDRLGAMTQLQQRLATATDAKDVQDLQARLQSVSCPRFSWTPICPTGGSHDEVQHEQDRTQRCE